MCDEFHRKIQPRLTLQAYLSRLWTRDSALIETSKLSHEISKLMAQAAAYLDEQQSRNAL